MTFESLSIIIELEVRELELDKDLSNTKVVASVTTLLKDVKLTKSLVITETRLDTTSGCKVGIEELMTSTG